MPQIEVDVDMWDFDTDDIVSEVCRRIKEAKGRKELTKVQKELIKETFGELHRLLTEPTINGINIKTLDDKMKYEHILSVFDKYTASQVQQMLP